MKDEEVTADYNNAVKIAEVLRIDKELLFDDFKASELKEGQK